MPYGQFASVKLCQPRTEADGKPVTESNLSLRAFAQVAACAGMLDGQLAVLATPKWGYGAVRGRLAGSVPGGCGGAASRCRKNVSSRSRKSCPASVSRSNWYS